jgi:hypothetical protein
MYSCVNGIHGHTNMTTYTKLSMDTINTTIHDCLLSWLDVGGHISVSMDTINTNIHDRLLSWFDVGGHISVSNLHQARTVNRHVYLC